MTGPLQPTQEDRFRHVESLHVSDPESYEEGQSMADGSTYDPGPSFVEGDHPTGRLSEMPAWLQSFAAQETTRDEAESDAPVDDAEMPEAVAVEDQQATASPDDVLPEWLRDQNSHQDAQMEDHDPSTMMDFLSGFDDPENLDSESFISEDDLPDWLRAFSEESGSPGHSVPEITRLPAARSVPQTGSAIVRVPPVENVWLTTYERQALGPGGTLFALLASNGNGTHAQSAGGGEVDQDARTPASAKRDVSTFSGKAGATSGTGEPVPEKQSNSLRLLLLTLLVVLLVVALSFWLFR